jgi:hypothetical protein
MRRRRLVLGGGAAPSMVILAFLCVSAVLLGAFANALASPQVNVSAEAEAGRGTAQVQQHDRCDGVSSDRHRVVAEAFVEQWVELEDFEDDGHTKHRLPMTFLRRADTLTLAPGWRSPPRRLVPFQLRVFASRAPPQNLT